MNKARYTHKQEIFNTVSHIIGGVLGLASLILCVSLSAKHGSFIGIMTSLVYGISMIILYTMSSIYHGLKPSKAKEILRVLDHCTIFILIAGTYTPILLCKVINVNAAVGWSIFAFVWIIAVTAILFTAVDLKKYQPIEMLCMLLSGWSIMPFYNTLIDAITLNGFYLILAGGIIYTIGAILYGIGSKKSFMHCVFHIFVLAGSILHLIAIVLYVL